MIYKQTAKVAKIFLLSVFNVVTEYGLNEHIFSVIFPSWLYISVCIVF